MDESVTTGNCSFGYENEFRIDPLRQAVRSAKAEGELYLSAQQSDFLRLLVKKKGAVVLNEEIGKFLQVTNDHVKVLKCHVDRGLSRVGGSRLIRTHYAGYSAVVPDEAYEQRVCFGEVTYFPQGWRAVADKGSSRKEVFFSREPNAILSLLADNLGKCVKKERIYALVQELGGNPAPKIIDVVLRKIRNKLNELVEDGGQHVVTVWGVGTELSFCKVQPPPYFASEGARAGVTHVLGKSLLDMYASA